MRGNKISVMIGSSWFESVKQAEITLGIHNLRERYNAAVNKGRIPLYKGQNIYYNVPEPIVYKDKAQRVRIFGEPLISKPVTCWLGSH